MRERIDVRPGGSFGIAVGERATPTTISWTRRYLRQARILDAVAALLAGVLALAGGLGGRHELAAYVGLTVALPMVWLASMALGGGYQARVIGAGVAEFRRVIIGAIGLTLAIAAVAFASAAPLSRGYLAVTMPSALALTLAGRYWLRKRLHKVRALGGCMRRAVAVGHRREVETLISELRREPYHGLSVVAVCLVGNDGPGARLGDVPVHDGLGNVMPAVRQHDADTVTVLGCPEITGRELRKLAWELEKTGTDLCLAPALLDVAGPRTSIQSAAGLPLLYLDHPHLTGAGQAVKSLADRLAAACALLLLTPLLLIIAIAIKAGGGGPVFARPVRVGRNGRPFHLCSFRITAADAWLRRSRLDGLPRLFNVLLGQMSLVGPGPATPEEAARYGDELRRRLAVRPGITGLVQVSGEPAMPPEMAARLDLRYVENWSFALDLQILWRALRPAPRRFP